MANLRRLIFKRFGGTSNFLSYLLLALIVYLLMRNYLSESPAVVYKSARPNPNPDNFVNSKSKNVMPEKDPAPDSHTKEDEQKPAPPIEFDKECIIQEKCATNHIPYRIVSGNGIDNMPIICLNGKVVLEKSMKDSKIGRGINLVVVDQNTLKVKHSNYYDTFVDDTSFFRYLKSEVKDGDIVMLASFDEMTNALRETTSVFMQDFGSQLFSNVKYRDSFVMIGQKGVKKGKAIEMHEPKKKKDYAPAAIISGCTSFPLGIVHSIKKLEMQVNSVDKIVVKEVVENCGLRELCKENEFAVHVYSGANGNDEPKICVDGRYVIAKGVNDAGRGLNMVVVGNGKEIIKTAHFDTYSEDSTNLEIFLESLYDNTIIIAVTFDEASTRLGNLARNLLFDLGSGLIQNLKFRDAWFFVGRKGIEGFTPIEEISYGGPENAFPKTLDKRFCVSKTLTGQRIRPDPLPNTNDGRKDFCSRYDGYGDFCTSENIDKPIKPAPIINKTLEEHPVYNMPIIIIGGMSHNSLRMTLETVIMQPGIRPDQVYVCLDEKLTEQGGLVDLFGFNYVSIPSSNSYVEIYHKSLEKIWKKENSNKVKDSVIIIEEELILSPDFLYFFSQVYDTYINDPNVIAVSGWNFNSFSQLDGSPNYVYRTDEFPGLGFMMKKNIYESYMKNKLKTCCNDRAWNNWKLSDESGKEVTNFEVIIPDVSRVFRRPYDLSKNDFSYLKNLFNRKRKTNLIPFPELNNLASLKSSQNYKAFLKTVLQNAIALDTNDCYLDGKVDLPTTKGEYYKVVFEQEDKADLSKLQKLTKCFHLFNYEDYKPKGLYDGCLLRFHAHHNNFMLIGSKSSLLL